MSNGRPCEYTEEIAAKLCSYLSTGESLRKACSRESMPCVATVFNWFNKFPGFLEQYARAKAESADMFAEDMLDISDDSERDFIQTEKGPAFNAEHVQRARLRVDTRKWLASKLKPKRYGELQRTELTGADGGTIQVSSIERHIVDPNKPG